MVNAKTGVRVANGLVLIAAAFWLFIGGGCAPAVIGGAATGGYKVGTDQRSVGRMWDDTTISAKVKSELLRDDDVSATSIDVDVVDGVVYLTGMVDSGREAARAVEIARKVSHVAGVRNNLTVGSRSVGQILDDNVIGSRVRAGLIKAPGLRSLNIDVDVSAGVVTLTGIVSTGAQKKSALDVARTTKGVVRVVDFVTVRED